MTLAEGAVMHCWSAEQRRRNHLASCCYLGRVVQNQKAETTDCSGLNMELYPAFARTDCIVELLRFESRD